MSAKVSLLRRVGLLGPLSFAMLLAQAFAFPSQTLTSHLPQSGCDAQLAWADWIPQVTADGATSEWKATALVAPSPAAGDFSAQVLWVGTNNQQADTIWVEGGITDGFNLQNVTRFYSAHGNYTVYPHIYSESLFPSAPTPIVGTSYRFKGYQQNMPGGSNYYRMQVDVGASSYYVTWGGHSAGTVDYSAGYEARGPNACNAQVDATYVFATKFRRQSDGVYIYPTSGTKVDASTQGTVGWCVQPTTLKYWMHSTTSNLVCP